MSDLKDWAIALTAKEYMSLTNSDNKLEAAVVVRKIVEVYEKNLEYVSQMVAH